MSTTTLDAACQLTEDEVLDMVSFEERDGETVSRDDLTPSQRRALRRVYLTGMESATNGGLGEAEPSKFEIVPLYRGRISVVIWFRRTDLPENAAGNIFPQHAHFFIGSHGGIEIAGTVEYGKRTDAQKYPLIYGWTR